MRGSSLAAGAGAGALLFSALFLAGGSSDARLLWIGGAAILLAGLSGGMALMGALPLPRLDRPGVLFLGALAGLAAWAGGSLGWSVVPDRSWDEFDRALVYLAFALVGVLLGALLPQAPHRLAAGLAILLGAVAGWALLGKIFPGLYAEPVASPFTRLRNPIGYWNALALLADLALPLALWLATERRHRDVVRAAGVLGLYTSEVALLLTYSRAGIVIGALVVLSWCLLAPSRLESVVAAGIATVPALAVSVFAFTRSGLSHFHPHSARVHDGAWFGLVLALGAGLAAALALAASRRERARPLPAGRRRHLERRAAAGIAAAVIVAVAGLAIRAGGPSAWWREFTNPQQVSQGPGRPLSASSNNRWTWWGEAWQLAEEEPLHGHGAGSFAVARRPIRHNPLEVSEPHNTALQFLSELGIVGLLLAGLALAGALGAGVASVRRAGTTGRLPALALVLGLGAYLLHALVDYDWEFVAVTGPMLLVAGALAGEGRPTFPSRRRVIPAGIVAVCVLAALYSVGAPRLAARRVDHAYAALDRGDVPGALSRARSAHRLNPLSYEPYWALAGAALTAGDERAARVYYERAAILQPENSDTWYALGQYDFATGVLARACYALDLAYRLDPRGPAGDPGGLLDRVKKRLPGCPAPGSGPR